MCDLDAQETSHIVAALVTLRELADKLKAYESTIIETNYMDHDALGALLEDLRDQANTSADWVRAKPLQHAGHEEHQHE